MFVDPIDNPASAAATFFPSKPSSGSAGPDKNTYIRQQLFGSSSATLNSELNSLMPRLCTSDRHQLQALQDGWNNLYAQLQAAATASQNCMAPGAAPAKPDFPTSAKLQMDILALALACDLTRVCSLQFSTATSQVTHTWLGSNQGDMPPQLLPPRAPRRCISWAAAAPATCTTTWASARFRLTCTQPAI